MSERGPDETGAFTADPCLCCVQLQNFTEQPYFTRDIWISNYRTNPNKKFYTVFLGHLNCYVRAGYNLAAWCSGHNRAVW